jgi:mitogen-activated protein kinase 7
MSFPERSKVSFEQLYPASSPEAIDFISKCLKFNPKDRIRLDEALEHPYFAKVFILFYHNIFYFIYN